MVDSLAKLYRYLEKPEWERAFEIVQEQDRDGRLDVFFDWAQEHYGDTSPDPVIQSVLDDPDKMYEVYLEDISPQVFQAFYDSDEWPPPEAFQKSWNILANPKIVKNQWLIHFTEHADAIAQQGFKHGVDDLTQLGNYLSHALRIKAAAGKFNFAYLVSSSNYRKGLGRFGHEAVVFKASGVSAYHKGDREIQVIFQGDTARDIVPITREFDGWVAGGLGKGGRPGQDEFKSLPEAVNWVVENYGQYKRLLTRRP
jgi:hypothetical protein